MIQRIRAERERAVEPAPPPVEPADDQEGS
jgi:hypothetical protein